jgi:hypothetical protein
MHKNTKIRRGITGTGMSGKTGVIGFLERGGRIAAEVLPGIPARGAFVSRVKKYVLEGSEVHTDAAAGYLRLYKDFQHKVVDHAECFVKGNVHTNGLENFWSLLKRGIKGTYVSVEPFHLFRYLSEQVFRFNERKDNDQGRFFKMVGHVMLPKLTYSELTGDSAE